MAIHERTVYIKPSELERINRLLAIESLEEMTDGELIAAGANTNHLEGLFHIRFDDGSYLNIDLCSGTHNYWDDMEWMNAHGTHGVVLDPEFEFGDIEFEAEGEFYLVHFTTNEHADKSCQIEDLCTYDRSEWQES